MLKTVFSENVYCTFIISLKGIKFQAANCYSVSIFWLRLQPLLWMHILYGKFGCVRERIRLKTEFSLFQIVSLSPSWGSPMPLQHHTQRLGLGKPPVAHSGTQHVKLVKVSLFFPSCCLAAQAFLAVQEAWCLGQPTLTSCLFEVTRPGLGFGRLGILNWGGSHLWKLDFLRETNVESLILPLLCLTPLLHWGQSGCKNIPLGHYSHIECPLLPICQVVRLSRLALSFNTIVPIDFPMAWTTQCCRWKIVSVVIIISSHYARSGLVVMFSHYST